MSAAAAVPFFESAACHTPVLSELTSAAQRVIGKGWYILGTEVAGFRGGVRRLHGRSACDRSGQWTRCPYPRP